MSWLRKSLLVAGTLLTLTTPVHAQLSGRPIDLWVSGGIESFDARDFIQDAPAFEGGAGYRWSPRLSLQASFLASPSKRDLAGEPDHIFSWAGADLRWTMRDPSGRVVPYFLTGFGFGRSIGDVTGLNERGAPSLGLGVQVNMLGNERTYLKLQARDVMMRESGSFEASHHVNATLGLSYSFGGKSLDRDLDGVRDWIDECPDTPVGAKVDAKGCPIDTDGDKVFDGLDKCEDTPRGCEVDPKTGCSIDRDGDGVCDGLDNCADTPAGAKVDARGCPIDSDGDKVFDGLDKCENTPTGAVVDTSGCPVDQDGDGIADGIDQCPNTPAGLQVDPNGCPIEVSERETQLLDMGVIRLQDVNFDVGKASIRPESFPVLDEVAAILLQYPSLQIEIGGHTDNTGGADKNQKLSEMRAKAVLGYLGQKYPTLDSSAFTTVGYGQTQPVATNATALGKAQNRRVDFKVLNADVLKVEREKRRFLKKGEPTPGN